MSEIKDGNIVKQYRFGNTTVKICDDHYRNKTSDELELIDKIVAKTAWECVLDAEIVDNSFKITQKC